MHAPEHVGMLRLSDQDIRQVSGGMMKLPVANGAPPVAFGQTEWITGWTTPLPAGEGVSGIVIHFG